MESQNLEVQTVSIGDKFSLDNMHWRVIEVLSKPFKVDRYPAYTEDYVKVKITDKTLKEITFGDRRVSCLANAKKIN